MRVRCVRRHVPSGSDVAVLGATASSTPADRPMIALTLSRPEALELGDELQQRPTPRSGVYDLMVSILGSAGATVTDIEVTEAPGQSAHARLQLDGPRGRSEIRVEVGQAISLSVKIGKPIQVSEGLIEAVKAPSAPALPDATTVDGATPSVDTSAPATAEESSAIVPEQFRRAFE
jgi:bifunctional DNase/RNase